MKSLELAWTMLVAGARNSRVAFHVPILATVGTDGKPRARAVVLRECDREARTLRFNTDSRSPKLEQMQANPMAEMVFYDEYEKIQLRVGVRLEVISSIEAAEIWEATPEYSRECYRVTRTPGSPIEDLESVQFDAERADGGKANFAPIRAHIESIEWLLLSSQQHRRARFLFTGQSVDAQWLVP